MSPNNEIDWIEKMNLRKRDPLISTINTIICNNLMWFLYLWLMGMHKLLDWQHKKYLKRYLE